MTAEVTDGPLERYWARHQIRCWLAEEVDGVAQLDEGSPGPKPTNLISPTVWPLRVHRNATEAAGRDGAKWVHVQRERVVGARKRYRLRHRRPFVYAELISQPYIGARTTARVLPRADTSLLRWAYWTWYPSLNVP